MSCLQWECDRLPQTVIEYNGIVISVLMIYEWFVLTLQCNNLLLNGLQVFSHFAIVYDLLPAVGWQSFSLLWVDSDDRRAQHTRFQSQILYKACAYYLVFSFFGPEMGP